METLSSREVQAVLHVLDESDKSLANIEIVKKIINMNLLPKKENTSEGCWKNSLKSRVSRAIKKLKELNILSVEQIGKTNEYFSISKNALQRWRPFYHHFSDTYRLSLYPQEFILSRPKISLYGVTKEMEESSPRIKEITIEIKKLIDELGETKKKYRQSFLERDFDKAQRSMKKNRLKKFLRKYNQVLVHIINHTDWTEEMLLKNLSNLFGFREVVLSGVGSEDFKKLKDILPREDKKLSDQRIKIKYKHWAVSTILDFELWDYPYFRRDLSQLDDPEKQNLMRFLIKIQGATKELYPTRISIVAHSDLIPKIPEEIKIPLL